MAWTGHPPTTHSSILDDLVGWAGIVVLRCTICSQKDDIWPCPQVLHHVIHHFVLHHGTRHLP